MAYLSNSQHKLSAAFKWTEKTGQHMTSVISQPSLLQVQKYTEHDSAPTLLEGYLHVATGYCWFPGFAVTSLSLFCPF